MTLQDALSGFRAVKGVSSAIGGILNGDFSVLGNPDGTGKALSEAKAELAKAEQALRNVQSDYAYWAVLGDVTYWRTVCNLMEAADLCGPDALPDVAFPPNDGIVMDLLAKQERFGNEVLRLAREQSKPA